jgi:hypothetical protein
MNKVRPRIGFLAAFVFCLGLPALAQVAPSPQRPAAAQEPPVQIQVDKFRVEAAAPPGGGGQWLRLLADFSSRPGWADGIVFYYDVLVAKGEDFRVLSGTARYSNVKRGNHSAVLYMSPSAFERFGTPIAAIVRSSYKDEPSGELAWKSAEGGSRAPKGWETQVQRYPGQLVPINFAPFVASEYGKYPDLMPPK